LGRRKKDYFGIIEKQKRKTLHVSVEKCRGGSLPSTWFARLNLNVALRRKGLRVVKALEKKGMGGNTHWFSRGLYQGEEMSESPLVRRHKSVSLYTGRGAATQKKVEVVRERGKIRPASITSKEGRY